MRPRTRAFAPCSTAASCTPTSLRSLKDARKAIAGGSEPELRKLLRSLGQQLHSIQARDFFPGKPAASTTEGFERLRLEVERKLSPGEPKRERGAVPRLDVIGLSEPHLGDAQAALGRSPRHRLAGASLRRPAARVSSGSTTRRNARKTALGFDFDGARFTHVADKVTLRGRRARLRPRRRPVPAPSRRAGALPRCRRHPGRRGRRPRGDGARPAGSARRRRQPARGRLHAVRRPLCRAWSVQRMTARPARRRSTADASPRPRASGSSSASSASAGRPARSRSCTGAGRAAALDLGEALPACAQLLHAAARARGAAARHLHRLADAPHLGRHRRRRRCSCCRRCSS